MTYTRFGTEKQLIEGKTTLRYLQWMQENHDCYYVKAWPFTDEYVYRDTFGGEYDLRELGPKDERSDLELRENIAFMLVDAMHYCTIHHPETHQLSDAFILFQRYMNGPNYADHPRGRYLRE